MKKEDVSVSDSSGKKSVKRNRLNLRIADDELETLNLISYEDEESISQIIRKAIKMYDTLRKNKTHYF